MESPSSAPRTENHPWLAEGHAPIAGRYMVERVLGQGGMGTVFEARHVRLGQRVAIKALDPSLREYPELVQRFEREARACGSLSSAHAVRIFDIDTTEDGTPFIVMELLAGKDLSQILDLEGPQPVGRAVRWVIDACDAIAEAHSLGIIHRDLKPSNLFLTGSGENGIVKVLDFGIAKRVASNDAVITHALAPLGTPQYMSPEQIRCAMDVDARTDVWSLGVTLYELVTGRPPFMHTSASACIAAIAADPVPDPRTRREDLDPGLAAVLMRALAKQASDRYPSVDDLVAALVPFANSDEELSVVVERVVTSPGAARAPLRLARPRSDAFPTLSPDPADVYERALASVPARAPIESGSDRTVPPVATYVHVPAKRRFLVTTALGAAAAFALTALVVAARLGGAGPTTAGLSPSASDMASVATLVTVEIVAPPPAEEAVPPAAVPVEPRPQMRVEAKPRPFVAAPASEASAPRRPLPTNAHAARASATAPRVVHGGLTNPGF